MNLLHITKIEGNFTKFKIDIKLRLKTNFYKSVIKYHFLAVTSIH